MHEREAVAWLRLTCKVFSGPSQKVWMGVVTITKSALAAEALMICEQIFRMLLDPGIFLVCNQNLTSCVYIIKDNEIELLQKVSKGKRKC